MLKVALTLLVFSALLLAGTRFVSDTPTFAVETTLLLSTSVWLVIRQLSKMKTAATFAQAYLGSIVLQLLGWVGYIGAVFYIDRTGANANAVYFLINCLIFISLEVLFLYRRKPT